MDLAGILKVVNERGGGHINKSFQPLLDSTIEAAGTSEVPVKKVSRKKKSTTSEAGTAATTDVADVVEKEVPSEGTMGITHESEVVVDKGMTKLKLKRLKKKDVISPTVGDNLMEIEEAVEEEAEEEETLQVRSRRQLQKTTSFLGAKSVESEETKSDEVISKEERTKKRHQKQQARTEPSKRPRKTKSSAQDVLPPASEAVGEDKEEEEEEEHIEENPSDQSDWSDVDASMGDEKEDEEVEDDVVHREGKGVAVEEEEDKEEAEGEEEGDGEELESEEERPPTRKSHLGVLSKHRLTIPNKRMMKRYSDVLLGSSSHGARMDLNTLPQAHEITLMMRNIDELFALSGHSLRRLLKMDAIRKRYRKGIRRVKAETVEEENKRLKAELEKEKSKGKISRERIVMLHNDLLDKSPKNDRLHDALNKTSEKLIKGKEIEEMFPMPSTSEAIMFPPVPQISAPEAPPASDAGLPHLSELNASPSLVNDVSEDKQADTTIESLQLQLQDYENGGLTVMDLKEELYESQIRLSEADDIIQSLHFEMKNLEDRWMSKTKFLEGEQEKIRATLISYAMLEDTSTSSSDKQVEDPSLIVVEDPMSAIIVYEPPPTFGEEDRESIGEFEMSSSEDVDSLFDD
ncbi:hypothetical protein Dimus_010507 [Dionaea muscipula]